MKNIFSIDFFSQTIMRKLSALSFFSGIVVFCTFSLFQPGIILCASAPSLSYPSNNHTICKGSSNIYFDWSYVSGASYYEIWIDNHSGFGTPEIGYNSGSPNWVHRGIVSTSEFGFSTYYQNKLPQNKYYWKVRALNSSKNALTSFSSSRYFILLDRVTPSLSLSKSSMDVGDSIKLTCNLGSSGSGRKVAFFYDPGSGSLDDYYGGTANSSGVVTAYLTAKDNWVSRTSFQCREETCGRTSSWKSVNVTKPKPDLIVQNQSVSKTYVKAGDSISLSCKVKNQGQGSAGSSKLRYYLSSNSSYSSSDVYLDYDSVSSLSSGNSGSESENVRIPSNTSSGTKYILFRADADSSVSESNESNNVSYKKIYVNKPSISLSKSSVTKGESLSVSWSGFSGNVNVAVYRGSNHWVHSTTNSSSSGTNNLDTSATNITWEPRNDYRVKVELRSDTNIYIYSSYFEVKPEIKPDFVAEKAFMSSISFPGDELTNPKVGDTVFFQFQFRVDDANVNNFFKLKCYLDNSLFYSTTYNSVQQKRYYPSTIGTTWNVRSGNHSIKWKVDSDNQISESSESNNEATKTWDVPEQFNIYRGIIEIVDNNGNQFTTVYIGDTVYFKINFQILGEGTTPYFDNRCEVNGSHFWTKSDFRGSGGNSYSITTPSGYLVSSESITVKWILDYNNDVDESDESDFNNISTTGWTSYNRPIITINYPNSNETLIKGYTYNIKWDSQYLNSNISIDLFRNNSEIKSLTTSSSNTGTFPFCPDDTLQTGSGYHIKICSIDNQSCKLSNNFNVADISPKVQVTPLKGKRGSVFNEPGSGFSPNNTATLHFTYPDGHKAGPITKNIGSDGSFQHSWQSTQLEMSGRYFYYAVDDKTGAKSNEVIFIVWIDGLPPSNEQFGVIARTIDDSKVFWIKYNKKFWINDENILKGLGYSEANLQWYDSNVLNDNNFPLGNEIFNKDATFTYRSYDKSTVYVIKSDGKSYPFYTWEDYINADFDEDGKADFDKDGKDIYWASSTGFTYLQGSDDPGQEFQGYLDNADCDKIRGWAALTNSTDSVKVRIYDGPSESGILIKEVTADLFRADLLTEDKNHGFEIEMPVALKNNQTHQIHAYFVDNGNVTSKQLSRSPKTFSAQESSCQVWEVGIPPGNEGILARTYDNPDVFWINNNKKWKMTGHTDSQDQPFFQLGYQLTDIKWYGPGSLEGFGDGKELKEVYEDNERFVYRCKNKSTVYLIRNNQSDRFFNYDIFENSEFKDEDVYWATDKGFDWLQSLYPVGELIGEFPKIRVSPKTIYFE